MTTLIQRIFAYPLRLRARPAAPSSQTQQKLPLAQIKQTLHHALHGCTGVPFQRASYKINQAKTAAELWELRSALHQCIAQVHSERVATARINELVVLFEGWLPASQLLRIEPGFRNSAK